VLAFDRIPNIDALRILAVENGIVTVDWIRATVR
jgi:hypothetical protein